ncbi:NAD(P)H-hydrate dehydratase [Cloacibacillus sp. An23]|uniref:NAD(P)H-hydrate dehydratase n=1 Tax=Cloacibacillus sp. An23 TaxID=1965591 RepID=UPI000B366498|nr:NAD(P)H-hydrate dehydratase [Cloacibacillus sp. An23]OUO92628.1 hypothetical protein B5F39_10765 [Cloacibacillus sp. An23]
MQKFYMPSDVREADSIAAERLGVPSVVLMENAARAAADAALSMSGGRGPFAVLAGHGNNGGDGFAAARHLMLRGHGVTVIKTAADDKYKGDAAVNLGVIRKLECAELVIKDASRLDDGEISAILGGAAVIVDALLGTGASGAPRGEIARLIRLTDGYENILSLDIPSGADPDEGGCAVPCVRASATVTFLAPKKGMAFSPALEACGKITTADIGVPAALVLPENPALTIYCEKDIRGMLPPVMRSIHKTERGSLLICAGSAAYRGAPLLAALGALRAGAGLVYLAVPDFIASEVSAALPEAVILPLPTDGGAVDAAAAAPMIAEWMPKCGAAAIGPGMGRGEEAGALFSWFWENWRAPLLIDADMLYFFARELDGLEERDDALLTPHGGEAARILGLSAAEVEASREASARLLTRKAGFALLKGRNTLIASASGELRMIGAGSPALAVPGSGDVLSGVIGALMASGLPVMDAAAAGALAHGAAGERLEERNGLRGTLAREIADEITQILR